ncbi:helix-turn-helix domain-containing protein [Mycobacterium manitobense]|uniref:Helix-turn-helix domain-containing protein n=1 Tax=[Mycobacterium] manitobense TaxID=190147 RepID=A0A9X3C0C7_9MYCO|nr:helix-turn-helix domain-containing protein [[Mycobacterium] manitobense]MCV7173672.1 helix-turn-helix domain-containing protein [[Mycobacterium] manitobense]
MRDDALSPSQGTPKSEQALSAGLAALSDVTFSDSDAGEIFLVASAAIRGLGPCQFEASYRSVNGEFVQFPSSAKEHRDIERHRRSNGDGQIEAENGRWGWAYPMRHRRAINGCLVVSATSPPSKDASRLLSILAQQAGAALAHAAAHDRSASDAAHLTRTVGDLKVANRELATTVERLQRQSRVHEVLSTTLSGGTGEQGIADALNDLTGHSVAVEDRFGNLLCWAGPGLPRPYPKQEADQRHLLLHDLAARNGRARIGRRVLTLVQPRAEVLGVLALNDPDDTVTEDDLFALHYGAIVLALELSHQRAVADIELNLRRDLVDDLLAGTDRDGAYARADALDHDLRCPHYVVVVRSTGPTENALATAAGRAATALNLSYLQGRSAGLVVLLTDGRPDPQALYRTISEVLGETTSVIGIGSRCLVPDDFPQSFTEARRAMSIRLRSMSPQGAAAFDELGFYRLVDAADGGGEVEGFVREWLGVLLDYDVGKNSELVMTLSDYLECGGNYDESAAALHIHRSTLRYRLARIAELTGHDLRNVDTRFNLHAATRAWRFLNTDG